jgi:hypothetical protein
MKHWITSLPTRSLIFRMGFLAVVTALLVAGIVPVGILARGADGASAVVAAAMLCLLGTEMALILSHSFRIPQQVLWGVLLGMSARMGPPILAGIAVQTLCEPLARGGFLYYLLFFYLVTLAVETVLSLPVDRGELTAES